MRVLGIETSCPVGSVALVERGEVIACAHHDEPQRHGERLLPLVEQLLAECGWSRSSLERLGVGVGPGSFTGLRVGIALAAGMALGLGVPLVGVGSLRALAHGYGAQGDSPEDRRLRVVVRDARRNEYFVAAYDERSEEVRAPEAIPQALASEHVRRLAGPRNYVVLGTPFADLPCAAGELTRVPDARAVAQLAATLDPSEHPALPHYVRGPNAIRPKLPPSPLGLPRT